MSSFPASRAGKPSSPGGFLARQNKPAPREQAAALATAGHGVRAKSSYDKRRDESSANGQTGQQYGVNAPYYGIRALLNPVFERKLHCLDLVPGNIGFFQPEKETGDRLGRSLLQAGVA